MSSGHESVHDLLELYALDAVTPAEARAFEAHLASCVECRAGLAAAGPVTSGLAHTVPQIAPPPGLRQRVLRAATGSGASAAQEAPAHVSPKALPWLLAAASLFAAVIAGGYAAELRRLRSDLETELQQTLVRATAAEEQIAAIRRAALEARSQLDVLAAPDVLRIDLSGQNAPAASARAFWSRSRGLVFTASNLPPVPAGRVYQLWVLTAAGPPMSVGLLQPDQAGSLTSVFQTPSDMPPPSGVAVSDEPAGGVPAPTGTIWVAGPPSA